MVNKEQIERKLLSGPQYRQAVIQHLIELEGDTKCELRVIESLINKLNVHFKPNSLGTFKLYNTAEGYLPFLTFKHNIVGIRQALGKLAIDNNILKKATI